MIKFGFIDCVVDTKFNTFSYTNVCIMTPLKTESEILKSLFVYFLNESKN